MKWNIKKSEELKMQIAENEKLVSELSRIVKGLLEKNKIELKGYSYILEPRVFELEPAETPEIAFRARSAMAKAIVVDLLEKDLRIDPDVFKYIRCLPECGIIGPKTLEMFEKLRIVDHRLDELLLVKDSVTLIDSIIENKALLNDLSKAVFKTLAAHGIEFAKNEDCVFTPFVFKTPVFAQKIASPVAASDVKGFGPQVVAAPAKDAFGPIKPLPGIYERDRNIFIPSVKIERWWWIGIPDPEMLIGLDRIREMRF